jgi:hypothetical protein
MPLVSVKTDTDTNTLVPWLDLPTAPKGSNPSASELTIAQYMNIFISGQVDKEVQLKNSIRQDTPVLLEVAKSVDGFY